MTVNSKATEEGLQAWMAGDLDALERLLDPDATLRPGWWLRRAGVDGRSGEALDLVE